MHASAAGEGQHAQHHHDHAGLRAPYLFSIRDIYINETRTISSLLLKLLISSSIHNIRITNRRFGYNRSCHHSLEKV
jgi:hypothetical protein